MINDTKLSLSIKIEVFNNLAFELIYIKKRDKVCIKVILDNIDIYLIREAVILLI